jgi:hypothetical protein
VEEQLLKLVVEMPLVELEQILKEKLIVFEELMTVSGQLLFFCQ